MSYRKSYKYKCVDIRGSCRNLKQSRAALIQQQVVKEDITTGVSAYAKLREYYELCALLGRLMHIGYNLLCVIIHIGNSYLRRYCRCLNKAILHKKSFRLSWAEPHLPWDVEEFCKFALPIPETTKKACTAPTTIQALYSATRIRTLK